MFYGSFTKAEPPNPDNQTKILLITTR